MPRMMAGEGLLLINCIYFNKYFKFYLIESNILSTFPKNSINVDNYAMEAAAGIFIFYSASFFTCDVNLFTTLYSPFFTGQVPCNNKLLYKVWSIVRNIIINVQYLCT